MLRLDDIAPNMHWGNFEQLQARVDQRGIKPLIGVIPDNRDPELLCWPPTSKDFWHEIRTLQRKGWTVALHGYQHRYGSPHGGLLGVHRYSEFAGLSFALQREKLVKALGIFADHGIETDTFMAPGHGYDLTTLRALRDVGIRYVTDGYALFPFEQHHIVFVPQIVARPQSLRFFPFGIFTTCVHLNEMNAADMSRLESFVDRNAARFIPFSDARQYIVNNRWNEAIGATTRRALHTLRRVRRGLR